MLGNFYNPSDSLPFFVSYNEFFVSFMDILFYIFRSTIKNKAKPCIVNSIKFLFVPKKGFLIFSNSILLTSHVLQMSKYAPTKSPYSYDELFSYYTRQIFCLDASFWYFSHLLICNFNAKLKSHTPFIGVKLDRWNSLIFLKVIKHEINWFSQNCAK